MTRRHWLAALVAAVMMGGACSTGDVAVARQEAKVACGMCRFHIPGSQSCYWAVELDGKPYAVVGADTPDHDSHGPDGMCVMDRRAVVAGKIKRDQFIAETFELLPAEGVDPNATPVHDHVH